jgi:hypothetical protein
VTTALWPALAVAVAGLALAQPAQANLALTVSDSGGVIAACNATDGGTGTFSKGCANPNFSQIIVTAVGAPLLPAPGLFATQISLTSGNARSADTLTIDVAQTGLSLAAGTVAVNLTVGGMGPSPVTLTALGPGGGVLLSQTFTTPGHVTSDAIPIAAGSGDNARFVLQFSGPNQTVNALISLTGQSTAGLADPSQPGSVIIWPKFVSGSVNVFPGTAGAFTAAKTVIELGAVCPAAAAPCTDNQTIHVHLHWVCPAVAPSTVCPETDFTVPITYGTSSAGKITFNPSAVPNPGTSDYNGSTTVPIAPCPRGYLIGYAVDQFDRPVKFDGLIGDTVQRNFGTALASISAITIQADPNLVVTPGANPTTTPTIALGANGGLIFDGAPGHYQMVTGQLQGDVAFDSDLTPPFHGGALVFLTLNVVSGLANHPTAVALDFYNFNEAQLSTEFTFTCWGQVALSVLDPNLTVGLFGSQTLAGTSGGRHDKGFFISGQASIDTTTGLLPVTLLGIVEASEGPAGGAGNATILYTVRPGNNSVPVLVPPPTFFPRF